MTFSPRFVIFFTVTFPSFAVLDEWMKYCREVASIYPNFFVELSKVYPGLTKHQIKLCALFLFECENSEIEARMGMSMEAVLAAKYRLRKKFKLDADERLATYLKCIAAGLILPHPNPQDRNQPP
jgi:hypothetical protein